jgi:hypothetical protein
MPVKPAYDFYMRQLIPASMAAFAVFVVLGSAPASHAQIHGVPTSVTSTGFGGHFDRAPGVRPSVTSLGPLGYSAGDHVYGPSPLNCCINPLFPSNPNPLHAGTHRPHHHPTPVLGGVYAVPYAVYITPPDADDSADNTENEQQPDPADYAPGPTIFDRRGSSQPSSVAEAAYAEHIRETRTDEPVTQSAVQAPQQPAPATSQPQTILIFKDGHRVEVQNYAIVGDVLYDVSSGRRIKIVISDLDLSKTSKENDDRGVDFQIPMRTRIN